MAIIKGVGDFFGLDIGTAGVRVVQLAPGANGRWSLKHYGYAPIDLKTALADSAEAKQRLSEVIMTVVGQSGIKTKAVAIGLPATKTFVTVIDVPSTSVPDLKSTLRYQLDQYIPMAVDDAKVDWAVLGQSPQDPALHEVLIASTAASYAEERLELIEGLGFDVIAAEPEPLATMRSVLTPGAKDAQVIVDMGEQSVNVVVSYGDMPRLVRTIPNGLSTLTHAAVQNLGVEEDQARQFILKFGLASDKLEGKIPQALAGTLDGFTSELSKSIKFFQTKYTSLTVGNIVLVGYAGTIPQMAEYLSNKLGIQVSVANPWQFVAAPTDPNFVANTTEFAVAVGLAQRGGDL